MAYSDYNGRSSALKRIGGIDREKEKANFLALSKPGDNTAQPVRSITPPTTPPEEEVEQPLQPMSRDALGEPTTPDKNTVPDRGATVLGIPVDKFAQIAGGLGSAFAPNTPMGRVGAFASNLAGQNIAEKSRSDAMEANRAQLIADRNAARAITVEDRADARRYQEDITTKNREDVRRYNEELTAETRAYNEPLRELQIKNAERQLSKKETPTEFGAFRSGQIQKGITDESKIVENYKALSKTGASKTGGEKYPAILKRWENQDNIDDNGNVKSGLAQLKEGVAQGDPVALKEYPEVAQQLGRLPKGEVRPIVKSDTGEIVYFYPKNGKIYDVDGKQIKTSKLENTLIKAH